MRTTILVTMAVVALFGLTPEPSAVAHERWGTFHGGHGWRHAGHGHYRSWGHSYGWGWPVPYDPYYSPWYGRPYFTYQVAPLVIPAELFFGPAAAARVAAPPPPIFAPPVNGPINGPVNGLVNGVPLRVDPAVNAARQEPEKERFSNAAARERAARFMEFGDRHFARGDYLQAYERYKLAVEAAPDLVEPFLRRGQALVALGNYTLAGQTFIHAFKMHPAWFRTDFRLDRIYGDRRQAKLTHLDALAEAAEKTPTAELMLLIAAQLFYDGQAERSLRFFERAKELNRGAADLPPAELPAARRPAPEQKAKQPDPAVF